MNWNAILGIACIISLSLPIAVILYHKYYKHRSLVALLVYYAIILIYLLMSQKIVPSSRSIRINYGIVSNLLDIPLMLTALLFFCPNKQKQNIVRLLTYLFLAYEALVIALYGFNNNAVTYTLAPGFVIILSYTLYLFMRQVKFSIMHRKNHGRMIMLASIVFLYSCYALTYFFYYIQKTPNVRDTEIIYFISTTVSTLVMAIGLQLMNKRMKELQTLRITRRELAMFFNH